VARKEKEVGLKERTARHTIDTAKAMAKTIDDEQAALNHREQNLSLREAAVKEEEACLVGVLPAAHRGVYPRW
jgi:hypothetical protein